jgi:hypothetical protein
MITLKYSYEGNHLTADAMPGANSISQLIASLCGGRFYWAFMAINFAEFCRAVLKIKKDYPTTYILAWWRWLIFRE